MAIRFLRHGRRRRLIVLLLLALAVVISFVVQPPIRAQVVAAAAALWPSPTVVWTVDVLVDSSPGSPGSQPTRVHALFDGLAPFVVAQPGLMLRVWQLGSEDASGTRIIATFTVAPMKGTGHRARIAHEANEARRAHDVLDPLVFQRTRASSLVGSIVRIGIESTPNTNHRLIIVQTDGLEFSPTADFECGQLPTSDAWLSRLDHEGLLQPGTLQGVTGIFVDFAPGPIAGNRCATNPARFLQLTKLHRAAFEHAGANVSFFTGTLPADFFPTQGGK